WRMQAMDVIEGHGAGVVTDWLGFGRPCPAWQRFVPARIGRALVKARHIEPAPIGTPLRVIHHFRDHVERARSHAPEWIPHIKFFPEISSLNLAEAAIGDAELVVLRHLDRLETLNVSGTRLRGPGLGSLARPSRLETLDISATDVDDEALARLGSLTGLRRLVLDHTRVTDAGLKHLARLPNLRELSVSNTQITAEGLEEMRRVNPRIEVSDD
ncbi:MAG TPA: hypothetical protein VKE94_11275, partial [Gemmataceae bacterium]|nr:hypothetical protein [Gemmataceae bacterium]